MKFTNSIAVLLAATSVLARAISEDSSAECKKEFNDKIQACFKFDGDLNTLCGSECDAFFNDPHKFVPHCMDEKKITEDSLKYDRIYRKMACSKDENGKQCPFGAYVNTYVEESEKRVSETCASAACTKATIEYYKALEPISKPAEATHMRDFIADLSTDECKAKQGKSSSSSSSSSDNKKTDDKTSSGNSNGSSSAPAANGAASGTNGSTPATNGAQAPTVNGNSPAANSTAPAGAAAASSDATTTKVGTTLMVSLGLLLLSYF